MTAKDASVTAVPDGVLAALATRYDVGLVTGATPLTGGVANDVFRLESARGALVLRVKHPPVEVESMAWDHETVAALADRLPEVHAPLRARDGSTFFLHDERAIWLVPHVEGRPADRRSQDDAVAAARALGRLHAAAASLALPPRPRHARLADLPFPPLGEYPHELDPRVRDLPHHDWQAWDLACATWEFSKGPDPTRLDATAARRFLGAYRAAGGPVSEQEDGLLRPLMRVQRILEVLRAPTDRRVDWSYQREKLLAAETLA